MLCCWSSARSCGVASSSQPPNTYGGLSIGTRPSIWSMTKNGVPSGPPSGSFQRSRGTGTWLRLATSPMTSNWADRS